MSDEDDEISAVVDVIETIAAVAWILVHPMRFAGLVQEIGSEIREAVDAMKTKP